jgi:hypothetical protein
MTSANGKLLQQAIAPGLKARGFTKTAATWRRGAPDGTAVLNLQGSQWGPQFYVNLGMHFRELDRRERPCENHCHIRRRLDALVPDPARLVELLDFERAIAIETRGAELMALVSVHALPWLERLGTFSGAREWLSSDPTARMACARVAIRRLLDGDG